MNERPQWAVFGGSFDPPHVAHVLAAAYVLHVHPVARVLVTPTAAHAFGKRLASLDDRVQMCELAFAALQHIEVCSIEGELPQPSYTLNTIQALSQRHPDVQLRLVVGSDLKRETHAWHDFERLRELAPPLWVARHGHDPDPHLPALPDVNSTDIRRLVATGQSTEGLLSPAVAEYIRARGLYRDAS